MSLRKRTTSSTTWIALLLAGTLCAAPKYAIAGMDKGYIFAGPREVKKTKQIKEGIHIVAYHQRGVFVSDEPSSPWYEAALFIQGTTIEDAKGDILQDMALCEATDADGDLNWSILWRPRRGTNMISFKLGTGKWEGITGVGVTAGMLRRRTDDHFMLKSEMHWNLPK